MIGRGSRSEASGSEPQAEATPPIIPSRDLGAVAQLATKDQWVAWRYEDRGSPKPAKVPIDPRSGRHARTNDPVSWSSFETAASRVRSDGLAGVGYVLLAQDELIGIDLDHVLRPDGSFEPWVQEIIDLGETYAERSPSRQGLRMFARGHSATIGASEAGVEIYTGGRFLTVTGWHVAGTATAINEAPTTLRLLHNRAEAWRGQYRAAKRAETKASGLPPIAFSDSTGLEELAELIAYVPPDAPYADWLRVGMGLHAQTSGGRDGLDLWDAWSARGDKYSGRKELEGKWSSFRGSGVGSGTIANLARQYGADLSKIRSKHTVRAVNHDDPSPVSGPNQIECQSDRVSPAVQPGGGVEAEADNAISAPRRLRLLTWADLKAERNRPREYLIDRQLRTGVLASVNARPGGGKTALLVEIAHALSNEETFNGAATKRCSVIYIAVEDEDDVRARLEARGADDVLLVVSEEPFLLSRPAIAASLVEEAITSAKDRAPDLPVVVMIDTLRAALGGASVIDDKNTSPGLTALREVAERIGATVFIANHTNRSDPTQTKGETLESLVALEYVLMDKNGAAELWLGKNRSGPGRQQIATITMKGADIDGVTCALIGQFTPFDPHAGETTSRRGRPSGAAKHLLQAIGEALGLHGTMRRVCGEYDAPLVRMVEFEHVRPIFARIYPMTEGSEDKRADAVRKALGRSVQKVTDQRWAFTENRDGSSWWWLPRSDEDFDADCPTAG